jgi:D-3-phosphoglycerate dehydrogenase
METSYPRQDIKVLLLEGVSASGVEVFHRAGYSQVELHSKSLPEAELKQRIADAHIVGIRSRTQLTDDVLAHAKRMIAVGCFCIGTNQVDLGSARKLGIPVFNAPYSNTRSVAELVIAEAIMLLRGIPQKNALCHRGGWTKSAAGSFETRDKVLGIVGYGHIGTQVGVLAESLGMRVIFYDIEAKLSLGNARAVHSLDELLERSDVVTLHVPETPGTQMMIAAEQLAKMHEGAMLINASRGTVVDIEALAEALRTGHLAGAAVDVFPVEPKGNDDAFVSPLVGMDNVILTPHIGGSTLEAQDNIGTLPEHPNSIRLLHIHRNVPGMLSRINELFSSGNMNIDAQFLQTDSEVGYVVIDVTADEAQAAVLKSQLAAIPGTLRSRVLY